MHQKGLRPLFLFPPTAMYFSLDVFLDVFLSTFLSHCYPTPHSCPTKTSIFAMVKIQPDCVA